MKSKILSLVLLTAILSIVMVSAAEFSLDKSSLEFTEPSTSVSLTITLDDEVQSPQTYSLTFPTITQDNDQPITFTYSGDLEVDESETITINALVDYDEIVGSKDYTGNLVITNTDPAYENDSLSIPVSFISSFCKFGENGTDLDISKVKIDNNDGDDTEWSPLDEITIEVEVSNDGNEKIKDVIVEIGLFDSEGKNVINDMDELDNEEIDLKSIKEDDEDTAIFNFQIPADFESENYRLVIKAYSDDIGEEELCIARSSDLDDDYYQSIDGDRETDEDKHVVVSNIRISPSPAECSDKVQISAEVFNIGDEDYEDQVKVTLYSQELGINLEQIIRGDLDQGDSETVEFEFDIPSDAAEKIHPLEFRTHYGYDEDEDDYDIVSEDEFTTTIRVEGGCRIEEEVSSALITAELDPETTEAVAGKQVIVRATLKNTGDVDATYTISALGNSAWSDLVSLDPQVISLTPGASRDINIVLKINEGIEGNKKFTIRASYDGKTTEREVELLGITGEETRDIGPFGDHLKRNWFIYVIIIINIILIIAIIAVIRRMVVTPTSM